MEDTGMQSTSIFQSTEFLAALLGVVAGFFFTLLSDFLRGVVRMLMKRRQFFKEIKFIRIEAYEALLTCIENDKIDLGSNKPPVICADIDISILCDNGFMVDVALSSESRRRVKSIVLISRSIAEQTDKMNSIVLERKPKMFWGMRNVLASHYYAFLLYNCDVILGKVSRRFEYSRNNEEFKNNNEKAIELVEGRYSIKIPRDNC